jgi:hypothetical protein
MVFDVLQVWTWTWTGLDWRPIFVCLCWRQPSHTLLCAQIERWSSVVIYTLAEIMWFVQRADQILRPRNGRTWCHYVDMWIQLAMSYNIFVIFSSNIAGGRMKSIKIKTCYVLCRLSTYHSCDSRIAYPSNDSIRYEDCVALNDLYSMFVQ